MKNVANARKFSFTFLREVFLSLHRYSRSPQLLKILHRVDFHYEIYLRRKKNAEKAGKLSLRSFSKLWLSLHRFLRSS